jgi:hypothetical protein
MFRQSLISKLPHWLFEMPFGDWPLHIVNAQHAKIGYLNEVMAEYRIHPGGVWSSLKQILQIESVIDFYDRMNSQLEYKYNAQITPLLASQCYLLAMEYEKIGDIAKARPYALRSILEKPFTGDVPIKDKCGTLMRLYAPMLHKLIKAFNSSVSKTASVLYRRDS